MTKKQAIKEAKARRANGEQVKAYCETKLRTVPGVGLRVFVNYFVA